MAPSAIVAFLILCVPCGCTVINRREGLGQKRPAHANVAADEAMIKPMQFNQSVLICNAYPSKSPMLVHKNKAEVLADKNHAIGFRECRYVKSTLKSQDRLDLMLRDIEVHGTFEVGELPSTDAVLLLVLEKRPKSQMISFQSFAFPASSDGTDAQLAVIDAYRGNTSAPHLKMEDHVADLKNKNASKRIEQLNFNHVYAVEEGMYDAFVNDHAHAAIEQSTKTTLKLSRSQNYVVLRTGEDNHFDESLVVFPQNLQSGSPTVRGGFFALFSTLCAWALA